MKVLLIEDSEADAEIVLLELEQSGYQIQYQRVMTAQAMQQALADQKWDLILSDFQLPQFDAPEALKIYKHSGLELPFIIISGVTRARDAVNLLQAGADDFIEKSDLARLVPAVQRGLRNAKLRRDQRIYVEKLNRLSTAVEQSPASITITDTNGRVEYVNKKFRSLTGYTDADVLGATASVLCLDPARQTLHDEIWQTLRSGQTWTGEICSRNKDDSFVWEYVSASLIQNDIGETTNYLLISEDITARKYFEEQLYVRANFDELTQLPNRGLLFDRLTQAVSRALESQNNVILMTIEVANFKRINDTFGYQNGDAALRAASARIRTAVGAGITVGRASGDEFAVILTDIDYPGQAETTIDAIQRAFEQPFSINDSQISMLIRIGVTVCPADGTDPTILFRNAEAAMHQSTQNGRRGWHFFTHRMDQEAERFLTLSKGLQQALNNGEFKLLFQPMMDRDSFSLVAVEALLRWDHPELGLIEPEHFIPIAEETGLIESIGKWVLREACLTAVELQNRGLTDLVMDVNASAKQLLVGSLPEITEQALDNFGLNPNRLELEVTESIWMSDSKETDVTLGALKDLGVGLSVDDFGMGYSSLSYLKRYQFDTLKIDKSFVTGLPDDHHDAALVEAILAMAKSLKMRVVAEGVETIQQRDFLTGRGCDRLQGFLFSQPVTTEKLLAFV